MLTTLQNSTVYQWYERYPERCALLLLLLLSVITRFLMIHHPESAVFDEVHFNYFSAFYYTGQYYYDIHPPLGKLLIAAAALPFGGIAPEDVVRDISTPYPSDGYIGMRMLPAIFGAALPLLIFKVARALKLSVGAAFLAGAIIVFDNALLIQSRLILLDAMLLSFGFLSLWLFLKARAQHNWWIWCLSAVFAGCSLSVKWIGVSFLGLIGLTIIVDWINTLWRQGWHIGPFYKGSAFLAITIITYIAIFYVHFALLPNSNHQGDQFMTPNFRTSLVGSEYYGADKMVYTFRCPTVYRHSLRYAMPSTQVKPAEAMVCQIEYRPLKQLNFFEKMAEITRIMYTTNQGLKSGHPDASSWYEWPRMHKPLYYWLKDNARIYLIGNPAVWWFCPIGIVILFLMQQLIANRQKIPVRQIFSTRALALIAPNVIKKRLVQLAIGTWRQTHVFWILMVGMLANLLPFMIVSRVMFMYHYLTCLCFSILFTAFLFDKLPYKKYFYSGYLLLLVVGFAMMSPLTYGINWYGSDMLWFLRYFGWHP